MSQKSLKLTSGPQASPAKTSRLQEWGHDLGFEAASLDCFMSLCGSFEDAIQEQLSSKTCTAFSLATEDETSESPSNAAASTLLPCIETGEVSEKYFLSQNAATGILRRVDRMGRNLPPSFRQSLEILSGDHS